MRSLCLFPSSLTGRSPRASRLKCTQARLNRPVWPRPKVAKELTDTTVHKDSQNWQKVPSKGIKETHLITLNTVHFEFIFNSRPDFSFFSLLQTLSAQLVSHQLGRHICSRSCKRKAICVTRSCESFLLADQSKSELFLFYFSDKGILSLFWLIQKMLFSGSSF